MSFKLLFLLAFLPNVAFGAPEKTSKEIYEQAKRKTDSSQVLEIVFDRASAELTTTGTEQLRDLLGALKRDRRAIDEIKVLAWADQSYPSKSKQKADKDARELADNRAIEIKGFLEDNIRNIDTDLYNMAERPHELEELFKTSDARVKGAMAKAGMTRTKELPRAGRALVFVILK